MGGVALALLQEIVSTRLEVLLEGGVVELELVKLTEKPTNPEFERFTLQLRGPLDCFLLQQTYMIRHQRFEPEPMFMVPVGQEVNGYLYEIVFHRKLVSSGGE